MRLDFVVRSDAGRKSGGDDAQIEHYRLGLVERGFEVRVIPFGLAMPLAPDSIVHLVNVDRPFEMLDAARQAAGRPVVVVPIHHDPVAVRAMRAAERGRGLRSHVDRLLPETAREWLVALARLRSTEPSWRLARYAARNLVLLRALPRQVGALLERAVAVALLAKGEGRLLEAETGWSGRNAVLVPNGLPAVSDPRPWRARSLDLTMVGRVEPRKRQLEIATIARKRDLRLTIVGALQSPGSPFGREFLRVVDSAPSVQWLGPRTGEETMRILSDSKVVINASWAEVQSLVDLEGAASGAHVVRTPAGHSDEWLGRSVVSVESLDDLEGLLDLAERVLTEDRPPAPISYDRTWDDAVDGLVSAYRIRAGA